MARHKKTTAEKYNQPFATRFRMLMNTGKRTSQAEIAEAVGKSRQVISQYYNGESEPPYDALVKIAQYFHVTVDYMIGATEVSSTSLDVKEIVRKTGISEESVGLLLENNAWAKDMAQALNGSGSDTNDKYINPRGELLNTLIEYSLQKEPLSAFIQIIDTLDAPSSEAFIEKIEEDEGYWNVIHPDAVRIGVESFFRQQDPDNRKDQAMFRHGMWELTPEDAFEFYCRRIGDGVRNYLLDKFKAQAEWRNIEPYREDLRKEIENVDAGWDEMMRRAQQNHLKSETEAE